MTLQHGPAADIRRIDNAKHKETSNLPMQREAAHEHTKHGAMVASAYYDPETIIGAIFGTGCNAAYMEDCNSIPKLQGKESGDMAINCEYGAFDNRHLVLPRTKYDKLVDEQSPKPAGAK